jgi:3-oxoacyl-[acyl-carrier protein] reductase
VRDDVLAGDVAVVTGSARGIGRAIAERFAEEGAAVVVADVDVEGGRATVDDIADAGGDATFVETDVSDADDARALVDATLAEYDRLDVLVNNAGGGLAGDDALHRVDEATWDTNVDVNLKGSFLCAREALPAMVAGDGGRMVHLSSVNGLTGIGLTAYSAAKAGILSLSRTIATQYGRHGVRSNAICPGTVETESRRREMAEGGGDPAREEWLEQYALGRFGRPGDVADAALYLTSDLSSFVTGSELVVDGGLTCGLDHTLEQLVYGVDEVPTRPE